MRLIVNHMSPFSSIGFLYTYAVLPVRAVERWSLRLSLAVFLAAVAVYMVGHQSLLSGIWTFLR